MVKSDRSGQVDQPTQPTPRPSILGPRYYGLHLLLVFIVLAGGGYVYTNYSAKHLASEQAKIREDADRKAAALKADAERKAAAVKAEADRAAAAQRAQALRFFCDWVGSHIDPDLEPPTTPRGEQTLASDRLFYKRIGCGKVPR